MGSKLANPLSNLRALSTSINAPQFFDGDLSGEYSVVSEDRFGQRFQLRFQITPVIPSLVEDPILGR